MAVVVVGDAGTKGRRTVPLLAQLACDSAIRARVAFGRRFEGACEASSRQCITCALSSASKRVVSALIERPTRNCSIGCHCTRHHSTAARFGSSQTKGGRSSCWKQDAGSNECARCVMFQGQNLVARLNRPPSRRDRSSTGQDIHALLASSGSLCRAPVCRVAALLKLVQLCSKAETAVALSQQDAAQGPASTPETYQRYARLRKEACALDIPCFPQSREHSS